MISSNVLTIDKITSDIASFIQNSLEQNGNAKVKLTVGSFTGVKMLAGAGPEIPIKISSVGKVNTDIKNEFIAQGINQTIHRIYMDINCEVSVLTPFNTISQEIYNKVLLRRKHNNRPNPRNILQPKRNRKHLRPNERPKLT